MTFWHPTGWLLDPFRHGCNFGTPQLAWCKENLSNLTTFDLGSGTHFIQEDYPHEIGEKLAGWYTKLG